MKEHPVERGYFATTDGLFYKEGRGYIKPTQDKNGYSRLSIGRKRYLAHRFVMECFFGHSKLWVNHKDFNKNNNRIENLEYVTPAENTRYSRLKGRWAGDIDEIKAITVITWINSGKRPSDLVDIGYVSTGCLRGITSGNNWKGLASLKVGKPASNRKKVKKDTYDNTHRANCSETI